jgi:hypothetical protein
VGVASWIFGRDVFEEGFQVGPHLRRRVLLDQ